MTANSVQQLATLALSLLLVVVGAAAFATDHVGPLPTNLAHGVFLNIVPGVLGLVCWRLRLGGLYLFAMTWVLLALGCYGFVDGPRWLYPAFNMSEVSSTAELLAGMVAGLIHYVSPEVFEARRLPDPDSLKTIELEGAQIAYVDHGEGEPVVLLHGYPQNMYCWRAQIEWLREGYRVIAIDFPEWGRSQPAADRPPSYLTDVERVRALLDALGLESVNLFTHDYGGLIGLTLLQKHPDRVRRFAIANSRAHSYFPPLLAVPTAIVSWMGRTPLLRTLGSLLPWEGIHRAGMLTYIRRGCFGHDEIDDYQAPLVPWRGRASLMEMFAHYPTSPLDDLRAGLLEITAPTAVIWGDEDPYCPLEIGVELAAAIPGATLHRLEGAEHFGLEERPAETAEALEQLLATRLAG